MTGLVLHLLAGAVIVGGLLWGASRWARAAGLGPSGRDEVLRVVSHRQLAKGAALVRVSVEDRDLLLGTSAKGVELLCELPKTALPARQGGLGLCFGPDGQPVKPTFAEVLARPLSFRQRGY